MTTHPGIERLLGVAEVEGLLGVGRRTVWRLIRGGDLAVVRVGRRVLVKPEDLRGYVERNRRAG